MGKASILLVEDDADIQQLVSYNLIKSGFNVTCADSGEEALQILENEQIDLILLDLMLPGKDGMEVCTIIREKTDIIQPPIIMLTAKSEEDDIVTGLSCGADDYVTKPFSPRVLIARVQAMLRRKQEKITRQQRPDKETIRIHSMVIHPGRHEVLVEGTSKRRDDRLYGRNSQNKVIIFEADKSLIGSFVDVKVEKFTQATLLGKLVTSCLTNDIEF